MIDFKLIKATICTHYYCEAAFTPTFKSYAQHPIKDIVVHNFFETLKDYGFDISKYADVPKTYDRIIERCFGSNKKLNNVCFEHKADSVALFEEKQSCVLSQVFLLAAKFLGQDVEKGYNCQRH